MEKLLVEVPPDLSSNNQRQLSTSPVIGTIFLIIISLLICSIFIAPVRAYLLKNARYLLGFKSRKKSILHHCNQCQYFESNPYLKCAVHPISVMTEAAIDCTDYAIIPKI